ADCIHISLVHVFSALCQCVMCASAWSEAIAVIRKLCFVDRSEFLRNRLLNHSVYYSWYSQLPYFAFLFFGYFYPSDRGGFIFSLPYLPDQFVPVVFQIGQKFIHLHSVNSTCSSVCFHSLVCGVEIVAPENNIKQFVRPKVRVGARVPGNPFMGVHSCSPSLFRRYLSQVVLDMKLSVLSSMFGFHLKMAPPIVPSFPEHL